MVEFNMIQVDFKVLAKRALDVITKLREGEVEKTETILKYAPELCKAMYDADTKPEIYRAGKHLDDIWSTLNNLEQDLKNALEK